MKTRLLSPDAGEGGDPVPPVNPPVADPNPQPAPPPAATVVANATRSERELQLEAELETERKAKKDREIQISELENENHQLKSAPTIQTPAQPAVKDESYRWRPFKL